jgi:hypothetical protein
VGLQSCCKEGPESVGHWASLIHKDRSLSRYMCILQAKVHIYRHMCMILLTIFSGSDAVEESGSLSFWDVSRVILG